MILDLTRRPLLVLYEQCPRSVVVRTFQTSDADGCLTVKREARGPQGKHLKMQMVSPGASLKRGEITCLETRIDLAEFEDARRTSNGTPFEIAVYNGRQRPWSAQIANVVHTPVGKAPVDVIPEPYEVVTGGKDNVTGLLFMWRAAIYIQHEKDLWVVTVRDVSNPDKYMDLCSVGTRDLSLQAPLQEDLPLRQLTKKLSGKPQTAWDHVFEDD